jgi:hypothetical protein
MATPPALRVIVNNCFFKLMKTITKHFFFTFSSATTHGQLQSAQSISEDQIKASLLSAVEDKMRRRLKEIFSQSKVI